MASFDQQEREEAARLDAQLAQLEGAFDNLYLTSTPYGKGVQEMFGNMEQQNHYQATMPYNNFQQLQVEETMMRGLGGM